MIDESAVRDVLNGIIDPCSQVAGVPTGLVEMGLVRSLTVVNTAEGAAISLTIGVTEPGCLMGAPFANEAHKRLLALPGVVSVEVALDHTFDWTPGDMSPEYRARLEAFRARRRLIGDVRRCEQV